MIKTKTTPRVFLDSCVIFAATNSVTGGSSKLFHSHKLGRIELVASTFVLGETEKNIRKKSPKFILERFMKLASLPKIIKSLKSDREMERVKNVINEKGALILIDTMREECDYLVTLDKKHFFTEEVSNYVKPTKIVTPGGLIKLLDL